MANQYNNKVIYNGTTLMDISDTTAIASDVGLGKEFYTASGAKAQGTAVTGNAISVVDTTDSNGGTIRTITAVDISDTTAVAADVASGKYFYTANGTKTAGTASGGGSSEGQTATGTVTGDGTNILQIPCSFEPDVIYVYGDMSEDVTNRGVVAMTVIKDTALYFTMDTSASSTDDSSWAIYNITRYNETDTENPHATYANGVLTIDTVINSSGYKWLSGQIYNYELSTIGTSGGGGSSGTQHTILFEFEDETTTTITAYYDSTFISSAITATTPTTYDSKTVTLAQLDGVTWYEVSSGIPFNTELVDYNAVRGGYVVGDSGAIEAGEAWECVTDYLPVDSSMTFTFKMFDWCNLGLYDANKNVVQVYGSHDIADSTEINIATGTLNSSRIPSTAKYVVLVGNPYNLSSNNLSLIRTA